MTVRVSRILMVCVAFGASALAARPWAARATTTPSPQTRVYFDQNEEEDYLVHPGRWTGTQLIPPWDPNGQLCSFPGSSGKFVTAYNPTGRDQAPNKGVLQPVMLPPDGEAVWNRDGTFSGQTIFVPGSYLGGDTPGNVNDPQDGSFHVDATYTGCAFDNQGNLLATDLGSAQGQIPVPDDGRLVEWFAPSYTGYCIVAGPTTGGTGPHHVAGTGGLRDPGTIAYRNGALYVPESGFGVYNNTLKYGDVLKFTNLPTQPCTGPGNRATGVTESVFLQTPLQPDPAAIARDDHCDRAGCWAVTSVLGGAEAIAWYDDNGAPELNMLPVPPIVGVFASPLSLSNPNSVLIAPYGIAFAPDGTMYTTDIGLSCVNVPTSTESAANPAGLLGCGPVNGQGRVLRFDMDRDLLLTHMKAVTAVATGLSYPVSVTVCTTGGATPCPGPPSP